MVYFWWNNRAILLRSLPRVTKLWGRNSLSLSFFLLFVFLGLFATKFELALLFFLFVFPFLVFFGKAAAAIILTMRRNKEKMMKKKSTRESKMRERSRHQQRWYRMQSLFGRISSCWNFHHFPFDMRALRITRGLSRGSWRSDRIGSVGLRFERSRARIGCRHCSS